MVHSIWQRILYTDEDLTEKKDAENKQTELVRKNEVTRQMYINQNETINITKAQLEKIELGKFDIERTGESNALVQMVDRKGNRSHSKMTKKPSEHIQEEK